MNNFLKAIIAGIGAKKFGGGCLGTIVVFIIIWVALGQCDRTFGKSKPSNQKEVAVKPQKENPRHSF